MMVGLSGDSKPTTTMDSSGVTSGASTRTPVVHRILRTTREALSHLHQATAKLNRREVVGPTVTSMGVVAPEVIAVKVRTGQALIVDNKCLISMSRRRNEGIIVVQYRDNTAVHGGTRNTAEVVGPQKHPEGVGLGFF
jgi:hypothetical protein